MEKKAQRGIIWNVVGNDQFKREMWEYFTLERAEVKKILSDAAQEKQEGNPGQWQQESPFRDVLEQVKGNADVYCGS